MIYSEFINVCTSLKNLKIQYEEYTHDQDTYYHIFAFDGNLKYECYIDSIENSSDISDFETNYKTSSNEPIVKLDSFGNATVAPTIENVMGLYPKKKMYKCEATYGQTNFFDCQVTVEKRINGGEYWIHEDSLTNVHDDDFIEFSVIDKDDTLGLFSSLGLTVGVDILELAKFVETDYVKKGSSSHGYYSDLMRGIKGTNVVYQGLYFRVRYESEGNSNIKFCWRLSYYE